MFFDTDCGGVVSNIAYLRFIEIARTMLSPTCSSTSIPMAEPPGRCRLPFRLGGVNGFSGSPPAATDEAAE